MENRPKSDFQPNVWGDVFLTCPDKCGYYHHNNNFYGGNGYITPHGPPPLMGGPDYFYPWYDRHRYGYSPTTGPFPPMAPPLRPPLPLPSPPSFYQQPPRPSPPPPSTQKSPQPPLSSPKPKPKPKIRYFPPKAPPVVEPPSEMKPGSCVIM